MYHVYLENRSNFRFIKEKNQHGPEKEITMKVNFVLKIVNMQGPLIAVFKLCELVHACINHTVVSSPLQSHVL